MNPLEVQGERRRWKPGRGRPRRTRSWTSRSTSPSASQEAVLNQYGITDGCVGCANSTSDRMGISYSEECRRMTAKEMKNDPEQRERIQETKRERRDFIERHAKNLKVDKSARTER